MTKFRKMEIEDCECGHEAPMEFVIHDSDGLGTCPNCVIEELTDRLKSEKRKSRLKDIKLKSHKNGN